MELQAEITKLVNDYIKASREYDRLVFDQEYSFQLGKPCSPQQIAVLEGILGRALPPSYRAFLELFNGFEGYLGNRKLLAVEDQNAGWVQAEIERIGDLFEESGEDNPFDKGAIPVELGKDAPVYLILDPSKVRRNGEMDLVEYEYTEVQDKYKDFVSFLRSELEAMESMVEDERKGADEDE